MDALPEDSYFEDIRNYKGLIAVAIKEIDASNKALKNAEAFLSDIRGLVEGL